MTDPDKARKIAKRIQDILADELKDEYTGEVVLQFRVQSGNVNGKVRITKDVE